MKKLLLSICAIVSLSANAQITVTNSDMPVVNDTIRISTTIDQWSIDVSATGNNYVWDFSFLTAQTQTVDTFVSVGSTPITYQFYFNNAVLYNSHKASYARKGTDFDFMGTLTVSNVYDYFKNDNGRYKNVGFGANINGLPASVRNIPIDTVYAFPLTQGSAYSSSSQFALDIPNTFYYGQNKTVSNAQVDGWGSITTPFGTFNCIRVSMDVQITDTISIDSLGINFSVPRPVETQYHWLANGGKEPILQINTIAGNITTIRYRDFAPNINSVSEPETQELIVYPNPAQEYVFVETPMSSGTLEIFDHTGRLVHSHALRGASNTTIPLADFANGIYIVRITSETSMSQSKFVVAH